ncbi:restriction endonuclease subunit S [Sorangium sp. So ce363]|uniref:restriction endonuclease subunit S n=1 Tax=Sorangium sp. So ce363 TaxID=3133304 RepID=UPI003F5FD854
MPDSTAPIGWRISKVRDLGEIQLGRQRSPSTESGANMVPYLRVANVYDGWIDYSDVLQMNFSPTEQQKYALRRGDILLNEGQSLELVGRSAVYDGPDDRYCFQNTLVRFRAGSAIDIAYARAMFKRWLDIGHFTKIAKQTTSIAHLGADRFAKLDALVPPLPEQRTIGQILNIVDTAILKTEQLIAKLKQMKQGLLHDLLTRGIDENGELRDPERNPAQFKASPLGLLPDCWKVLPCDTITAAPICYGIVQAGPYVPEGPFVLTIGDLKGDFRSGLHRTSPQIDKNYSRSRVRPSDLLLSIKGTIGKVAIVPAWYEGNISRDLARLRFIPSALPAFISQYMTSPIGQRRLELAIVGTTRAEISIHVLKRLLVPLASDEEQREIARRLEAADERISNEQAGAKKLRLLKQALMEDLLTGRVRVTPLLAEPPP